MGMSRPTTASAAAKTRANELRRAATPPEQVLWSRLRDRRLDGFKFRRQHPIGPFVTDFYCPQARLVVEIDSIYHADQRAHDAMRDAWMDEQSIRVVRVSASELAKNEGGVLLLILRAAREQNEKS